MSQSLLLKIVRESITEVFEAKNIIDREALLKDYPVLNVPLGAFVSLYIDRELRGRSGCVQPQKSLLETIIHHAKTAAFNEDPLTVSQYLHTQIELSLLTPLQEVKYLTLQDLSSKIRKDIDGVYVCLNDKNSSILPSKTSDFSNSLELIHHLFDKANISTSSLLLLPKVYTFEIEKSHDEPILS